MTTCQYCRATGVILPEHYVPCPSVVYAFGYVGKRKAAPEWACAQCGATQHRSENKKSFCVECYENQQAAKRDERKNRRHGKK